MTDTTGSFLLINQNNERFFLSVQSDFHINNYLELMKNNDDAPEEIVDALAKKQKLLCLYCDDDFNQPIENWRAYLHKANKINKLANAYYALVKLD